MKIRRSIWIALMATLALVAFAVLFVDVIPPRSYTYTEMFVAKGRILRYAAKHNTLPSSLTQANEIAGSNNSVKDAWGHSILYSFATNGDVTLTSLGKDNKVGGANDDADMIGIFPSKNADGLWSDEFVEWKQDPFYGLRTQKKAE